MVGYVEVDTGHRVAARSVGNMTSGVGVSCGDASVDIGLDVGELLAWMACSLPVQPTVKNTNPRTTIAGICSFGIVFLLGMPI
jgi:hypothetical protein